MGQVGLQRRQICPRSASFSMIDGKWLSGRRFGNWEFLYCRSPNGHSPPGLPPLAGLSGRNARFDMSDAINTTAPLPSLPGRKPSLAAVHHVSSCKTFRSSWTSQPGRPRVRSRWLSIERKATLRNRSMLITNLLLVPGELARGEINCHLKFFRQIAICRAPLMEPTIDTNDFNFRARFSAVQVLRAVGV